MTAVSNFKTVCPPKTKDEYTPRLLLKVVQDPKDGSLCLTPVFAFGLDRICSLTQSRSKIKLEHKKTRACKQKHIQEKPARLQASKSRSLKVQNSTHKPTVGSGSRALHTSRRLRPPLLPFFSLAIACRLAVVLGLRRRLVVCFVSQAHTLCCLVLG